MSQNMSDSLLDLIWSLHADGRRLAPRIQVQMTSLGPEIRIKKAQATYCWRRGAQLRSGRLWQLSPYFL